MYGAGLRRKTRCGGGGRIGWFYQSTIASTRGPLASRSGSGKRWKISEIGLAIPLQACSDMGLYCSFAFIAFDYKLGRDGLFVRRRAFMLWNLEKFPCARARTVDRYLGGNASIDHGSEGSWITEKLYIRLTFSHLLFYSSRTSDCTFRMSSDYTGCCCNHKTRIKGDNVARLNHYIYL